MTNVAILSAALVCLALLTAAIDIKVNHDLVLRDVGRGIDLSTNIARHKVTFTVFNSGSKSAAHIHVVVDQARQTQLAAFTVKTPKGVALHTEFLNGTVAGQERFVFYRVLLSEALKAQQSVKLVLRMAYADVHQPHPSSISQNEPQLVLYSDNHYWATPYQTVSQRTAVKLASSVVESYSQLEPTTRKGQSITYGPYEDVEPFSVSPLKIHSENNSPFIKATRSVRELEVSHWGNVAFESQYFLVHNGARLKGVFSRYDFQRNPTAAKSAVRQLRQYLPAAASDIYYRDEIGNISSSAITHVKGKGVSLQLVPRYVLFGGWKASFCVGYNAPLNSFLTQEEGVDDMFMLNVSFYDSWKTSIPTEDFEFRVVLPEGATDIEFHAPFDVDSSTISTRFTYLDTTGRPVLTVRKKRVLSDYNVPVQITYKFASTNMIHEPLLLIGAFFTFCLAVIVYSRVSLSLESAGGKSPARSATRAGECIARLRDVLERRDRLHAAVDEALSKLSKTRNRSQFDSEKTSVLDALDECTRDSMRLAGELEALDARKGAVARQIDAAERKRQTAHMAIVKHESAARSSGAPEQDHEQTRVQLDKAYQSADAIVERLAQQLLA